MKVHFVTVVLVVAMLHNLFGKIFNGYEKDEASVRMSIKHIRQLLSENPQFTEKQKRKLNAKIEDLTDILVYHQLTDTLLSKFQIIAPDLYAAIDTLRDHKGRDVDVYVKFVPRADAVMESFGEVMLAVAAEGDNVCMSEYGRGTVAVNIRILSNSLSVLSHEFGHLLYIVPNLADYVMFYKGAYRKAPGYTSLGHEPGDKGGRSAINFETQYRQRYHRFLRSDAREKVFPFAYMNDARERIERELQHWDWQVAGAIGMPREF